MKHARGPPRGPDVPPTVAANLPSISFDPRAARFCSRLSIVRETRLRDPSKNRDSIRRLRVVKVSLNRCISLLFRHFCFVPRPHPWKLRKKDGRRELGRILREEIGHPRRARMQESIHPF